MNAPVATRIPYNFIHIPKAGGTSMRHNLNSWGSHHATLTKLEERGFDLDNSFNFTFTRNPHDRLLSAYIFLNKYLKNRLYEVTNNRGLDMEIQLKRIKYLGHKRAVLYKNGRTFEDFIHYYKDDFQTLKAIDICFQPQQIWMDDRMNFIGKVETYDRDFKYICKLLGIDYKGFRYNTTSHTHFLQYYNREMFDIVSGWYWQDLHNPAISSVSFSGRQREKLNSTL